MKRNFVRGLILFFVVVQLAWLLKPHEPEWQGKPLRYWVENLRRPSEQTEALSALHEIGPRGIPSILRLRQERDTWLYAHYRSQWWPRLPRWLQTRFGDPAAPSFDNFLISDALVATGSDGIPHLAQSLKNNHEGTRLSVLLALQNHAKQGADLSPALPMLKRVLNDSSPNVRIQAAQTLGRMGPAAAPAVAPLIQRLSDAASEGREYVRYGRGHVEMPAVTVQAVCAEALGRIGPAARPALPTLASFENHPNPDLRFKALVSRRQLGDSATNFVPLITQAMGACPGSRYEFMKQVRQLSLSLEEQNRMVQILLTNRDYRVDAAGWQRELRKNL